MVRLAPKFGRLRRTAISLPVLAVALLVMSPVIAILAMALQGFDAALWSHLAATVLSRYIINSLLLMLGVSGLALCFAVPCAWLVVRYRFFASPLLEWLLLLPAAVPAYIIAYCYTDFFEYAGVVQKTLRGIFGTDTMFFEIRSLGGAVLVMASALYPYIYLLAKTAFRTTPDSLYEVALLHDRSLFWSVALPVARPAVIGGLALVGMETLADFGTVEFFAVETVTLGIYNLWLGMYNLQAATQLAVPAVLLMFVLLLVETKYRGGRKFAAKQRHSLSSLSVPLHGWRSAAAFIACCVPLVLGFILPVGLLLWLAMGNVYAVNYGSLWQVLGNSLWVSSVAAFIICAVSLFLVLVVNFRHNWMVRLSAFVAVGGYGFPGVILAIGLLLVGGFTDSYLGLSLLGGGIAVLLFGYIVRFNAVGFAALSDGVVKLPTNWLSASLVLGRGFIGSLWFVGLPLMRPSLLVGLLLCFVDVMKELPMSLLLRPFNFNTLATMTYEYAHSEFLELAALPALLIVSVGLLPIVIVNFLLRGNLRVR